MKEIIKKTFLLGLGAASLTKAELEKRAKVVIKKSGIKSKEGKEVINKILKESNKVANKLNKTIMTETKKAQGIMRKRYDPKLKNLKKRVTTLEKKLKKRGRKVAKSALKKASRKL